MGLGADHRLSLAQQLELLKLRNGLMASINFRITTPLKPHHWSLTLENPLMNLGLPIRFGEKDYDSAVFEFFAE